MRRKPPQRRDGLALCCSGRGAPGAAAWAGKDHGNLEGVGGDTGMGHAAEDGPLHFTFRTGLEWGWVGAWSQSCCSLGREHLKELEDWAGGRREGRLRTALLLGGCFCRSPGGKGQGQGQRWEGGVGVWRGRAGPGHEMNRGSGDAHEASNLGPCGRHGAIQKRKGTNFWGNGAGVECGHTELQMPLDTISRRSRTQRRDLGWTPGHHLEVTSKVCKVGVSTKGHAQSEKRKQVRL